MAVQSWGGKLPTLPRCTNTPQYSENDAQFKTKFELPYKDVAAPFFVTLGNHDYGGGGTGGEIMKKEHYLKYAKKNPKFVLPNSYWDKLVSQDVHVFSLDSNAMMFSSLFSFLAKDQLKVMKQKIVSSTAKWKISFSHHPYLSNGPHGNAGCYEGVKTKLSCYIPILNGKGVKEFFDDGICGHLDVHLAGHDHSRQWLKRSASDKHCKGVELIVSGAGAKTTDVYAKNKEGFDYNPHWYQDAKTPGFLWVEIKGNTFHGEFVDMDGKVAFERTFSKP